MAMQTLHQTAPFSDATSLLNNPETLRAVARRDGVLFFKKLLDPSDVLAVRRPIMDIAAEQGVLNPDSNPMDGLAGPEVADAWGEADGKMWREAIYPGIQKLREFHALAQHPCILAMFEKLFDGPVFAHPRNIARMIGPGTARFTTPPHQDNWYIRGSEETWTLWMPLGDCPETMGGLAVMPGSHHGGKRKMRRAEGAGGNEVEGLEEHEWLYSGFEAGDVVVFQSLTIHQGVDNRSDRVRVSIDFRYQAMNEPVHQHSLNPHLNILSWEAIYEDWPQDDPLKYYWKALPLTVVE